MKVQLKFKELDIGGRSDYVPYLWNEDTGVDSGDGTEVRSEEEFRDVIRGAFGAGNRSREVVIIQGREAASTIARMRRMENDAISIITDLGQDSYAIGSTFFDGSYDSGMPVIGDTRPNGEEILLEENLFEETFMEIGSAEMDLSDSSVVLEVDRENELTP